MGTVPGRLVPGARRRDLIDGHGGLSPMADGWRQVGVVAAGQKRTRASDRPGQRAPANPRQTPWQVRCCNDDDRRACGPLSATAKWPEISVACRRPAAATLRNLLAGTDRRPTSPSWVRPRPLRRLSRCQENGREATARMPRSNRIDAAAVSPIPQPLKYQAPCRRRPGPGGPRAVRRNQLLFGRPARGPDHGCFWSVSDPPAFTWGKGLGYKCAASTFLA